MPDLATHHILCIAFTFNRSINYIQNRLTSGNNGDTVVDGGTVAAVIDLICLKKRDTTLPTKVVAMKKSQLSYYLLCVHFITYLPVHT